jgi:hypothetical protein
MAFFWALFLAFLAGMLWYYALRAAFVADSRQRHMANKLIEEVESWFRSTEGK